MRPRRSYRVYLDDLLHAASETIDFVGEMDFSQFVVDRRTNLAVIRSLEVIGEAARQIPDDLRRHHPDLPWQEMSDMRNKLIHEYFGSDLEVVWRTVQEDLPSVRDAIWGIIRQMDGQEL